MIFVVNMFIDNNTILTYYEIGLLSEGLVMIEQTGIANTIDTVEQEAQYDACAKKLLSNKMVLAWILKGQEEADVMCNLGQGIREKAIIETTATIVMNIMNNEHVSFDEAYDSTYLPDDSKEEVKTYIKEQNAKKKQPIC